MVRMHDGRFPWVYLGVPFEDTLREIDMTLARFMRTCDGFTNKKTFVCDAHGNLVKGKDGNLTKINYDNVGKA